MHTDLKISQIVKNMYNKIMKLVVGLGNPGEKYAQTRHNIGQMVLDAIIHKMDKRECNIIFCKPKSFMNLSGEEVSKLAHYYKISSDNVWVIHDDVDLEFGFVRVRQDGSSGGHNGLKSIIEQLKTRDFKRVKIGIGRDPQKDTADYVLDKFNSEQSKKLKELVDKTADYVIDLLENGFREESVNFL